MDITERTVPLLVQITVRMGTVTLWMGLVLAVSRDIKDLCVIEVNTIM